MTHAIERVSVCGVPIDPVPPSEAVRTILARTASREPFSVHFCNAFTVVSANYDQRTMDALAAGSLNLPDGVGVTLASRLLGRAGVRRVPGPDLMDGVLGSSQGLRHYFLGGSPETLRALINCVRQRYAGAIIAGSESPPFTPLSPQELEQQVHRVRESHADIVWVGLGTPKQDWEVERLAKSVNAVIVAVGAAFDFLAGSRARAPRFLQRVGLEWLFRLMTEPRRLWRRYLIGNFLFARLVVRSAIARDCAARDATDTAPNTSLQ